MSLPSSNALRVVLLFGAALNSACSSDATTAVDHGQAGTANGGAHATANGGSDGSGAGSGAMGPSANGAGTSNASAGGAGAGSNAGAGGAAHVAPVSCKRGVAYGHHSIADLQALSAGVSWWYNWDFQPDQNVRGGAYLQTGVEYMPMIWGAKSDRDAAQAAIGADATALLGFNEPNFKSQAALSATAAAALWPQLEDIADAKGLRLVSPAVNFCGGDCFDTDPFHYLDAFFAACAGCRVDAIAIHLYVGCSPDGDNKAAYLIQHVETYKRRFSQPLWLTEFACNDAKNVAEQKAFMTDALAYLEAEPRIERYAWFSGRAENVANVDLLGDSGQLTALGQAYVNAPINEECTH